MKTFLKFLCLFLCAFALRAANTTYTAPDETGLVCYWKMDEGSGTNAIDYSGNNNTAQSTNSPSWTNGIIGGAISLNGVNQGFTIQPTLSITNSITNITISAWIFIRVFNNTNTGAINTANHIAGKYSDVSYNGAQLAFGNDYKVQWFINNNANNIHNVGVVFSTNQWIFIVGTYDGTNISTYYNGNLNYATNSPGFTIWGDNNKTLEIGYDQYESGRFFNGLIDDVRIYNRALSATEITTLYNFRSVFYQTNGSTGYRP